MNIRTAASAGLAALVFVTCTAVAQDSANVEAGADGFGLSSADGAWELKLRGLVHVDGRWFLDDSAPDNGNEWLLRRVRPSFEGKFGERLAFRVMPDFGGGDSQLIDAYIDTTLGGGVSLRAGKFKPPVGLERQQSSNSLRMVERSYVSELLPNRDVGALSSVIAAEATARFPTVNACACRHSSTGTTVHWDSSVNGHGSVRMCAG